MKRKLLCVVPAVVFALSAWADAPHWTYSKHGGPNHWGKLDGAESCKLGKEQSPIDIRKPTAAKLEPIPFAYTPAKAEVINNGHTIQVNLDGAGGISVEGAEYKLLQFHFHTPSEERVGGKASAMVAHLVHKNADGKLAVVALLFKHGASSAALAPVFAAMPKQAGEKAALAANFDVTALLPQQRNYYTFNGSLTTPPCSEGVKWFVMREQQSLSKAQITAFRKIYAMNARPVQPLHGREVLASEF
ncbi:MAG: carbonic anhydrase family protein [Rhodocyclaceae bacterium]|nr:carbonic anhydrase family protein [Rhodocyclaceae bacterium]